MDFKRKISVYEIAKIANVSASTVSRALNNNAKISEKTRKKINDIANELRYGTKVIPRLHNALKICFYTEDWTAKNLYSGMQKALQDSQHELFFFSNNDEFDVDAFNSKKFDGLIFLGTPKKLLEKIDKVNVKNIVRILGKDSIEGYEFTNINFNIDKATELMINYLKAFGDNMHFIVDRNYIWNPTLKREALLSYHAKVNNCNITKLIYDSNLHGKDLEKMIIELSKNKNHPMLLCCFGDQVFSYLNLWLSHLGLTPNKDYILIGCNNEESSKSLKYKPATIDLNFGQIGELSIKYLLEEINSNSAIKNYSILVDPQLVFPV